MAAAKKPAKKAPAKKPVANKPAAAPKASSVVALKLPKAVASFTPALTSANRLPPRLQAMVDQQEISQVIQRVARHLDRMDENALRAEFHPDASLDFGPGLFQGAVADYIHWVMGLQAQTKSTQHVLANCTGDIKGDSAFMETYATVHHRLDKATGREDLFIAGRYLDRLERRPAGPAGLWKIMHRKFIMDWVRTEPVADIFYHYNPDGLWGQRGKSDLSYQMEQFPGSNGAGKMPSFIGRRFEGRNVRF